MRGRETFSNYQQNRAPCSPTNKCCTSNNSKPEKVTKNLNFITNYITQCQCHNTVPVFQLVTAANESKEAVLSSQVSIMF